MIRIFALLILIAALHGPVQARDSLGIFERWGAFRDPSVPRCYAIAEPVRRSAKAPDAQHWRAFMSIGTWPKQGVRGQVHFRLSRPLLPGSRVTVGIGDRRFALVAGTADAWAADRRMDAAIVAAIRASTTLSVEGRASDGRTFADVYALRGAATAMDAAALSCARMR
jgi:hypothetical protein